MAALQILSPVSAPRIDERPLAARLDVLDGARIALLDNQKANAGGLLDAVGKVLARDYSGLTIDTERKIATSASPTEVMERLRTYDAVVLAIAD